MFTWRRLVLVLAVFALFLAGMVRPVLADNPLTVERVYIIVSLVDWPYGLDEGQWQALVAGAESQPFALAIMNNAQPSFVLTLIDRARGTWSYHEGDVWYFKASGGGFEIPESKVAYMHGLMSSLYGKTTFTTADYADILQTEFRAAAVALGYPAGLTVYPTTTALDRMGAINQNVAWYNNHIEEWYAPCEEDC